MTSSITDFSQYAGLRKAAAQNDPAALREVANQFEALFLQTMLKNMREASLGDPLFGDSDQHEMYQGMLDQQLAVEMASGKGVGLADMLVRQLGGVDATTSPPSERSFAISRPLGGATTVEVKPAWNSPEEFAQAIWPHAERAAKNLNVATEAIVAQAALETGWGKHVMPDQSGGNSFNIFGIKSNSAWQGDQVVRQTLEFEDGIPQQQHARFRAYRSTSDAFSDYTNFLVSNPRYSGVRDHGMDTTAFARALQDSGYATDPDYAAKINDILSGPTMRRVVSSVKNSGVQPITNPQLAHARDNSLALRNN